MTDNIRSVREELFAYIVQLIRSIALMWYVAAFYRSLLYRCHSTNTAAMARKNLLSCIFLACTVALLSEGELPGFVCTRFSFTLTLYGVSSKNINSSRKAVQKTPQTTPERSEGRSAGLSNLQFYSAKFTFLILYHNLI